MTPSESPDEKLLREWLAQGTPPPLPDDGFKLRVMAALPPPRPERDWRVIAVLAAGFALGLSLALHNHASVGGLLNSGTHLTDLASGKTLFVLAIVAGLWTLWEVEAPAG